MIRIVDAAPSDYAAVLRLNAAAVPHVNLISEETLQHLHCQAFYFRVGRRDGVARGFLLALPQHATYESLNFLWFKSRYPRFVYIDRVVVDAESRRQGIGRRLYDDLISMAQGHAPVLTCEVNLEPPNPGSMVFHKSGGFREVGQQDTEGGKKRVCLMARDL